MKDFENRHHLVVQWVARREEPVQKFRTPLGLVRPAGARGWHEIPAATAREQELVNEAGTPVTVTAPTAAAATAPVDVKPLSPSIEEEQ